MPIAELPDELMTDEVFKSGFRGLFVGGCIERKEGSSFRAKAHAHYIRHGHNVNKGELQKYGGWICIRSAKRINQRGLLIHELSHLVANCGHTRKFYETVRRLGGTITKNDRRVSPQGTKGL